MVNIHVPACKGPILLLDSKTPSGWALPCTSLLLFLDNKSEVIVTKDVIFFLIPAVFKHASCLLLGRGAPGSIWLGITAHMLLRCVSLHTTVRHHLFGLICLQPPICLLQQTSHLSVLQLLRTHHTAAAKASAARTDLSARRQPRAAAAGSHLDAERCSSQALLGPRVDLQQYACLDKSAHVVQKAGKVSGVVLPGMLLLQTVHALLHLCHTLLQPEALTVQLVRHLHFIHVCHDQLVRSITAWLLAHAQLAMQAYEALLHKVDDVLYVYVQYRAQKLS